jgi:hypothetical protein
MLNEFSGIISDVEICMMEIPGRMISETFEGSEGS